MQIKFSHDYPKLYGQSSAKLIAVEIRHRKMLSDKFVEYDTVYFEREYEGFPSGKSYYPLPSNNYMILVFIGNELIPFTTVRRWTDEKYKYYNAAIGKQFDIVKV